MRYCDGRFLNDQFFCLFVHNTIQRHHNNSQGNFFFNSDKFIGKNPPSVEDLKKQLNDGDARCVQTLRYFSRNIKGSDNFWRARQDDLEAWVAHHVSRGRGPWLFHVQKIADEKWNRLSSCEVKLFQSVQWTTLTQLTHLKRRQLCPLLAKSQHCGAFLNTTRNPGSQAH